MESALVERRPRARPAAESTAEGPRRWPPRGGAAAPPLINRFLFPLIITPERREVPRLSPTEDPCRVVVAELTNLALLQTLARVRQRTRNREDYYFYDFVNLLNRLPLIEARIAPGIVRTHPLEEAGVAALWELADRITGHLEVGGRGAEDLVFDLIPVIRFHVLDPEAPEAPVSEPAEPPSVYLRGTHAPARGLLRADLPRALGDRIPRLETDYYRRPRDARWSLRV